MNTEGGSMEKRPSKKRLGFVAGLCLGVLAIPAYGLAGEDLVWYAPNDPRNTGEVTSQRLDLSARALTSETSSSGNKVTLNGSLYVVAQSMDIFGGYNVMNSPEKPTADIAANNNLVTMNSDAEADYVIGGYARIGSKSSFAASATGNTVLFNGGKSMLTVYGGWATATDGSATATDNTVTIKKGEISSTIYGGYATSSSGTATASNNTVTIEEGIIKSAVYGGYATSTSGTAAAINNTVTIRNAQTFSSGLYGGFTSDGGDALTGNTLNLHASITAQKLGNFQKYNFHLPSTTALASTPFATITDGGTGENGEVDITGTDIHIGIDGNGSALQAGDVFTLIKETGGAGIVGSPDSTTGQVMQGVFSLYSYELTTTDDSLLATLTGKRANDQLKSLSESRIAGLGMLTMGADMLEMQAIPQLRALAPQTYGLTTFAAMSGSTMRYDSGSHVDVDGFSLATGLGWNSSRDGDACGNLLLGAFFEAGWGSYDSHNSFASMASVDGDGDTNYYGGGVLARYDTSFGLYAEGSFRAGGVDTDYNSSDFGLAGGTRMDFDSTSTYYGAHFGLGYLWNLTERSKLDVYGKYHWTRQDHDSVRIQGSRVNFETMDSHRVRAGARYAYSLTTANCAVFTPYAGAAYEYEFDSKAKANVNHLSIKAPEVKGGTGLGELGVSYKPSAASRFFADLGAQGYVGKREGVRGTLQFGWSF